MSFDSEGVPEEYREFVDGFQRLHEQNVQRIFDIAPERYKVQIRPIEYLKLAEYYYKYQGMPTVSEFLELRQSIPGNDVPASPSPEPPLQVDLSDLESVKAKAEEFYNISMDKEEFDILEEFYLTNGRAPTHEEFWDIWGSDL